MGIVRAPVLGVVPRASNAGSKVYGRSVLALIPNAPTASPTVSVSELRGNRRQLTDAGILHGVPNEAPPQTDEVYFRRA